HMATRPIASSIDAAATTSPSAPIAHVHRRRDMAEGPDYTDVQSAVVPGPDYRFGPFLVDRTRYQVLRDDLLVELTPKLLDLRLPRLNTPGRPETKDHLLAPLGPGPNVTDNALAKALPELRAALGAPAGTPRFIKTVARRGYRFIAPVQRIEGLGDEPVRRS